MVFRPKIKTKWNDGLPSGTAQVHLPPAPVFGSSHTTALLPEHCVTTQSDVSEQSSPNAA